MREGLHVARHHSFSQKEHGLRADTCRDAQVGTIPGIGRDKVRQCTVGAREEEAVEGEDVPRDDVNKGGD